MKTIHHSSAIPYSTPDLFYSVGHPNMAALTYTSTKVTDTPTGVKSSILNHLQTHSFFILVECKNNPDKCTANLSEKLSIFP